MRRELQVRPEGPARLFVIGLYLAVALWYLTWRLTTFNPDALVFSLTLYAAELYGFAATLLHIFMTWRLTEWNPPAPRSGLSVDVFIPTLNEPIEIVRRTALAATHMNYPHRTWLLDDGNRPAMRKLARELGCRYLARADNKDAKAGNLNNALARGKADFVAVFDADDAPSKNFLERTLGFFSNPRVALVQTPQDFYNLDSFQHRYESGDRFVWTEQSLFFRVILRGKDYWNAAFFCGSCGVIRRSALDSVGGFATGTVTEDLHTSVRLHKKGYQSVYLAEALAFGLAPPNIAPYLRQRARWGHGAMQVLHAERLFTAPGLTVPQRLCYLATVLTYFDGWQKAVFYLAPVIVLTTGVMPVGALGPQFFLHFIPFYLLTFLVFEEVARGYVRTLLLAQYNMARFATFAWTTFGLFRRRHLNFKVTQKALQSSPHFKVYIIPQYIVFALNAVAIPIGIALYGMYGKLPEDGLIANLVWASVNATLGFALLSFTLQRSSNRRTEYRFPIPLPLKVKIARLHGIYGTADNISSSGCRIHAKFPEGVDLGTAVRGEIHLPHRVLPFTANVRALVKSPGQDYVKAIGCRFGEWPESHGRDELERFLYGTDLQWHVQQLEEKSEAALDRLTISARRKRLSDAYWAPVLFDMPETNLASQIGLISVGEPEQRTLLASRQLDKDSRIIALAFTRAGQSLLSGYLAAEERFESPIAPIYAYRLVTDEREQEWIKSEYPQVTPFTERQAA
ncbi:MAG TPA: glycosyltransferase family 2 protein [Burkholderiales bacterium]|nr:glycosyltransferase family 2 protein [Burkholderiales bacterium]